MCNTSTSTNRYGVLAQHRLFSYSNTSHHWHRNCVLCDTDWDLFYDVIFVLICPWRYKTPFRFFTFNILFHSIVFVPQTDNFFASMAGEYHNVFHPRNQVVCAAGLLKKHRLNMQLGGWRLMTINTIVSFIEHSRPCNHSGVNVHCLFRLCCEAFTPRVGCHLRFQMNHIYNHLQ